MRIFWPSVTRSFSLWRLGAMLLNNAVFQTLFQWIPRYSIHSASEAGWRKGSSGHHSNEVWDLRGFGVVNLINIIKTLIWLIRDCVDMEAELKRAESDHSSFLEIYRKLRLIINQLKVKNVQIDVRDSNSGLLHPVSNTNPPVPFFKRQIEISLEICRALKLILQICITIKWH